MGNKKSSYKSQFILSLVSSLLELSNLIALLLCLIECKDTLVAVDFINSCGVFLSEVIVLLISFKLTKDLKYAYNYGINKIESLSALFLNILIIGGLLITCGVAINEFVVGPGEIPKSILWPLFLKVSNLAFDIGLSAFQLSIYKKNKSELTRSALIAQLSATAFDVVTLISFILMYIFRESAWAGYISPVVTILLAIYFGYTVVKIILLLIKELVDKTLPEKDQIKICKILVKYSDRYKNLIAVNSRGTSSNRRVDILLSFEDNTPYKEIRQLELDFCKEIEETLGIKNTSLVITRDEQ